MPYLTYQERSWYITGREQAIRQAIIQTTYGYNPTKKMYYYKNPITGEKKWSTKDLITAQERREFLGVTQSQLNEHFWAKYGEVIRRRQALHEAGFGQQPVPYPTDYYRRETQATGKYPVPSPPKEYYEAKQQEFMMGVGQTPIPYGEPEYLRYAGQYPQYIPPPPRPTYTYRTIYPSSPIFLDDKMKAYYEREALREKAKGYINPLTGLPIQTDYLGFSPTETYLLLAKDPKTPDFLKGYSKVMAGIIAPFESTLSMIPYQSTFKYQYTPIGGIISDITEGGRPTQTAYIFSYKTEVPKPFTSQEMKYLKENPLYLAGGVLGEIVLGYGIGKGIQVLAKPFVPLARALKSTKSYQGISKAIRSKIPRSTPYIDPLKSKYATWKNPLVTKEYYGYKPTTATERLSLIQKGKDIYEVSTLDLRLARTPISYEDFIKLGKVKPKHLEISGGQFTKVSTPKGEVGYPEFIKGFKRAEEVLDFVKKSKWGHKAKYYSFGDEAYPETGFMKGKGYKFFDERIGRATQTSYIYQYPSDMTTSYLVKGERSIMSSLGRPPTKEAVFKIHKMKRTRKGVKVKTISKRITDEAQPFALTSKRILKIDRIWGEPIHANKNLHRLITKAKPSKGKPFKPTKQQPMKGKPFTYLGTWKELSKTPKSYTSTVTKGKPLTKLESKYARVEAVTKTRPTTSLGLGSTTKYAYSYYGRVTKKASIRQPNLIQFPKFQQNFRQGISEIPALELKTTTRGIPSTRLDLPIKQIPSMNLDITQIPITTPKPIQTPIHRIPTPQKTTDEIIPLMGLPSTSVGRPAITTLPDLKPKRRKKITKKARRTGYRLKVHPVGEIKL